MGTCRYLSRKVDKKIFFLDHVFFKVDTTDLFEEFSFSRVDFRFCLPLVESGFADLHHVAGNLHRISVAVIEGLDYDAAARGP